MTDGWRSIRLTEFEHVVTGATHSLLRVCGQDPEDHDPGPRPVLVIAAATGEERFAPLRAPDDRRGMMRAAYAVPTSLVAGGGGCWLETSDGERIELPVPVEGSGRRRDEELFADQLPPEPMLSDDPHPNFVDGKIPDAGWASAEEREAVATARAEAAEWAAQLAQTRAAALEAELRAQAPAPESLREELEDLRARQVSLEHALDQARDQLRFMTVERDELGRQAAAFDEVATKARERANAAEAANERTTSALNELQVWRAELEGRLADTTSELGALRAQRDADERELARVRSAVGEDGRHPRTLTGNGADAGSDDDELIAIQAQEIQRLAAELAELRSRAARDG